MATAPDTIKEVHKVMEDFFLASKESREDPDTKITPMVKDLPEVDGVPLEDFLLKNAANSASRSEAAVFKSLTLLKSVQRESLLRRMTRKKYMEDLAEYYDNEADYYDYQGKLMYQYATGKTPIQKG
jgi:hypothetical protein